MVMETPSKQAPDSIKKLGELIHDIKFAMLTSTHADGSLHSRPMATQQMEFDGNLWFFTGLNSEKVRELESNPEVNLSYSAPDDQRYVSVSGRADVSRDREKMKELWNPLLKAWFPGGLDDPDICLLHVDVTHAEYLGFTFQQDGATRRVHQVSGHRHTIEKSRRARRTGYTFPGREL